MKTKILAGLLVAAALAIAPGCVALDRGGGGGLYRGGDFHGGGGFYRGGGFHGGFAHHGWVSDRSFLH